MTQTNYLAYKFKILACVLGMVIVILNAACQNTNRSASNANASRIAVLSPPTVWRGANADGAEFSPDGKSVVTSYEGEISLWNAEDGKLLQNLVDPNLPIKRHYAHDGIVRAFAFTSDRQKIITGGFNGYVKIWNAADGTLERTLPKQKGRIYKLFISDDNRTLAAVNRDSVGE